MDRVDTTKTTSGKTMIKKAVEKRNVNSELFSIILPLIPNLLLKSGWAFLRFKMDAKRGGNIFQKELMNQGLDKTDRKSVV